MHHPKYLLELKSRAERALNQDPPDGLTAFTAAWALWEAVRKRILVLACKREGWTVEQARESLPSEAINQKQFLKLYTAVSDGETWEESLPMAAGALWADILEAMEVRLRIINGSSRIGEDNLQRYAWSVLRFINRLRDHQLGDPLKELPKRSRKTLSDESLEKRLKTAKK